MYKKLSITLPEELIKPAKKFLKSRGQTLSGFVRINLEEAMK